MKAELHFDLDDPGDVRLHREAIAARGLVIAIMEIHAHIRSVVKYSDLSDETQTHKVMMGAQERLILALEDHDIAWVLK